MSITSNNRAALTPSPRNRGEGRGEGPFIWTLDVERWTLDVQKAQRSTFNVQRSTFNAEPRRREGLRRGYVLVVTLALLVLSATVMVGVARMAIRQTSLARQAQDDLQQRWGAASIRVAVMPFAEQILLTAEASQKRAIPILNTGITLGGQSFGV